MKRFITGTFELMLGVSFVLVIVAGAIAGFPLFGFIGSAIGCLAGFVIASVMFGALYILIEIRDSLRQSARITGLTASPAPYPPAVSQLPVASAPMVSGAPIALATVSPNQARCPHCGFTNAAGRVTCGYCSKPLA
jgi:hypothetical protein